MPKTINRLTSRNSLLRYDESTGVRIPLRGNQTFQATNFSITGNLTTLIVPSGYQFYVDELILVEGMGSSILTSGSVISGSVGYSVLDGKYRVSSFASGVSSSSVTYEDLSHVLGYTTLTGTTSAEVTPIYTYDWQVSNAAMSLSSDNYIVNSCYVLEISPAQAGSDVVLTLSDIPLLLEDNSFPFSFNAKIKTTDTSLVECTLYLDNEPVSGGLQSEIYAGSYATLRSNVLFLPDDETEHTVSIHINISGHNGQPIYLTLPHLINDYLYYQNRFVYGSRNVMPDFYWEIDSEQENPSAPLHRLIDCLTVSANEVWDEYLRIYPYELTEIPIMEEQADPVYRSVLVDPNHVDDRYASWLAQFNGTTIKRNIVGADGTNLLQNQEMEREYVRWQVRTGFYGKNAGTREALMEAAKQALLLTKDGEPSTQAVALTAQYNDDVFRIRIQTLVNETADVENEGESSAMVLDAIEPARPMGYLVEHRAVNDFEFTVGDTTLGVLDSIPIGSTVD